MSKIILIDTSVWIFALRKKFISEIKNKVEKYLLDDVVAVTPIIKLELLGGTKTKEEFERLKERLNSLHQLKITEEVWEEAENIALSLNQKGLKIPYTDILIASVAILSEVILMHADTHFNIIAKNSKLKVESLINLVEK